jgi:hypothetical protein
LSSVHPLLPLARVATPLAVVVVPLSIGWLLKGVDADNREGCRYTVLHSGDIDKLYATPLSLYL